MFGLHQLSLKGGSEKRERGRDGQKIRRKKKDKNADLKSCVGGRETGLVQE
jgi:hypothetical protein